MLDERYWMIYDHVNQRVKYGDASDIRKRKSAVRALQHEFDRMLRDIYEEEGVSHLPEFTRLQSVCRIATHGSTYLELFTQCSDIDAILLLPVNSHTRRIDFFDRIHDKMMMQMTQQQRQQQQRLSNSSTTFKFNNILKIKETFVPILKFEFRGFKIDISICHLKSFHIFDVAQLQRDEEEEESDKEDDDEQSEEEEKKDEEDQQKEEEEEDKEDEFSSFPMFDNKEFFNYDAHVDSHADVRSLSAVHTAVLFKTRLQAFCFTNTELGRFFAGLSSPHHPSHQSQRQKHANTPNHNNIEEPPAEEKMSRPESLWDLFVPLARVIRCWCEARDLRRFVYGFPCTFAWLIMAAYSLMAYLCALHSRLMRATHTHSHTSTHTHEQDEQEHKEGENEEENGENDTEREREGEEELPRSLPQLSFHILLHFFATFKTWNWRNLYVDMNQMYGKLYSRVFNCAAPQPMPAGGQNGEHKEEVASHSPTPPPPPSSAATAAAAMTATAAITGLGDHLNAMCVLAPNFPRKHTAFSVRKETLAIITDELRSAHEKLRSALEIPTGLSNASSNATLNANASKESVSNTGEEKLFLRMFREMSTLNTYNNFLLVQLRMPDQSATPDFRLLEGFIDAKLRTLSMELERNDEVSLARIHSTHRIRPKIPLCPFPGQSEGNTNTSAAANQISAPPLQPPPNRHHRFWLIGMRMARDRQPGTFHPCNEPRWRTQIDLNGAVRFFIDQIVQSFRVHPTDFCKNLSFRHLQKKDVIKEFQEVFA